MVNCELADRAVAIVDSLPRDPHSFEPLIAVARALDRVPGRKEHSSRLLNHVLDSPGLTLEATLEALECSSALAPDVVGRMVRLIDEGRPELRSLDLAFAVARQRGGLRVVEEELEAARGRWQEALAREGLKYPLAHTRENGLFQLEGLDHLISSGDTQLQACLWLRWHTAREGLGSLSEAAPVAALLLRCHDSHDLQVHRARAFASFCLSLGPQAERAPDLSALAADIQARLADSLADDQAARLILDGNIELAEMLAQVQPLQLRDYPMAVALAPISPIEARARLSAADSEFHRLCAPSAHSISPELVAVGFSWKARALAAIGDRAQAECLLALYAADALSEVRRHRSSSFQRLARELARVGDGHAAFAALRKAAAAPRHRYLSSSTLLARLGDLRQLAEDIARAGPRVRARKLVRAVDGVPAYVNPTTRSAWLDELEAPDGIAQAERAVVLAHEGRTHAARVLLAAEEASAPSSASLACVAQAYAALYDRDAALSAINRSLQLADLPGDPSLTAVIDPEEIQEARATLTSTARDETEDEDFEAAAFDLLGVAASVAGTSSSDSWPRALG